MTSHKMHHGACSNDINRTRMPFMGGLETGKLATYLGDLSLNHHVSLRPHTSRPSVSYRAVLTKNPAFTQRDTMADMPNLSEFNTSVKNGIYYTGSINVITDTKDSSVPLPTQIKSMQPNTEHNVLTLNPYIRPVSASEIVSANDKKAQHTLCDSAAVSSFPEMSSAVSHTHLLQRNSFLRPLNGTPPNKRKMTSFNIGNMSSVKQDICDSSLQRQNSYDSDLSSNSGSRKNGATFANTYSSGTTDHHKHTDSFSSKSLHTSSTGSFKINTSGSQASLKLDLNTNFNSAKCDMEANSYYKHNRSMYDMPSQSRGIFPSISSESKLFTAPNNFKSADLCQPMTQTLTSETIGASGNQTYKKVPVTSTLTGLVYYKRISESSTNSTLASENKNSSNMVWQNANEKTAGSGTLTPSFPNNISILTNCNSSFEKPGTGVKSYMTSATEIRPDIIYHSCQNVPLSAKLMQNGKFAKPPFSLKNTAVMNTSAIPQRRKDSVQDTSKLLQDNQFKKTVELESNAQNNRVSTAKQRSVGDGAPSNINLKRFSEVSQAGSCKVLTTQNTECGEEESDDCDGEGNDDAFSGSLEEDEEKESFAKGERLPGDGEENYEDTDEDSELENFPDNTTDDGTTDSSSGNKSSFENSIRPTTADFSQAHLEEGSEIDHCLKSSIRPRTPTVPVIIKPAFTYSLFCHIPPTINFVSEGEKAEQLPVKLSKLLKWKISPITPGVVKTAIARVGFRVSKRNHDWLGCFGKHMKSTCFKSLRDYQKLNHFPGSFQIGRKDKLWRSLSKMQVHFGKQEFNFFPQTFILPTDTKQLKQVFEESSKQKWIIKPPASARGIGIRVISKWSQIPRRRPVIVQRYIHRPFLINSSKFDMRIYVYVSCYDPLRLYVYEDGLARFASCKYSSSSKTFNNRYMHLTNYSINKKNANYLNNTDNTVCQGHKWSLKALWSYMKRQGINTNLIWETIRDLIIKTIISGDSVICSMTKFNTSSRYCCHELFGFDILLDENFKPWILEVNISPSLHSNSELDISIKGAVIKDMLNIAGFRLPDERDLSNNHSNTDQSNYSPINAFCMDKRLFTTQLAPDERAKHAFYCQKYMDELNNLTILGASKALWGSPVFRDTYLRRHMQTISSILNMLTPDDIRILCESIDEDSRKGSFQRLFPTPNTYRYLRYFEQPRYYNLLLDQWVLHYNHREHKGIQLLQSYCERGVHLENPTTDPLHQWTVPRPSFVGIRSSEVRAFGLHNSARESGHHLTPHRNVKKLPGKSGQLSHSSSTTSLRSLAPSPHPPKAAPLNPASSSSSNPFPEFPATCEDLTDITKTPHEE